MDHHVTLSMEFMVKSHHELVRTLAAERDAAVHASRVIGALPMTARCRGSGKRRWSCPWT